MTLECICLGVLPTLEDDYHQKHRGKQVHDEIKRLSETRRGDANNPFESSCSAFHFQRSMRAHECLLSVMVTHIFSLVSLTFD